MIWVQRFSFINGYVANILLFCVSQCVQTDYLSFNYMLIHAGTSNKRRGPDQTHPAFIKKIGSFDPAFIRNRRLIEKIRYHSSALLAAKGPFNIERSLCGKSCSLRSNLALPWRCSSAYLGKNFLMTVLVNPLPLSYFIIVLYLVMWC